MVCVYVYVFFLVKNKMILENNLIWKNEYNAHICIRVFFRKYSLRPLNDTLGIIRNICDTLVFVDWKLT